MHRLNTDHPFTCVVCEFAIAGTPEFHVGLPFCCAGCVAGGPCVCSYDDQDLAMPSTAPDSRPVLVLAGG